MAESFERGPTQGELGELLGVSVSTVSLALSGSPKVKAETRERVWKLARKLRYRPNLAARSLVSGRTLTVGILSFSRLTHPFFAELVEEIHRCLQAQGYAGIFLPSGNEQEYQEALDALLSRRVDGILSRPVGPLERAALQEAGVPVIFHGDDEAPADSVSLDCYQGGVLATEHLIRLGHARVGFVGEAATERRFLGYRDSLSRHGLPLVEGWVAGGRGGFRDGYEGMKAILTRPDRPSAVFAHNDAVAIGGMRACIEAGLRVPEDLALVGFDNIEESAYQAVPLTTVEFPKREFTGNLVELLLKKIEAGSRTPVRSVMLKPRLILRESCGHHLNRPVTGKKGATP